MKAVKNKAFPLIETEPYSDWSFFSSKRDGNSSLILAYAMQRDFLSVPKSYQMLIFSGSEACPLEFHHLEAQDYLLEMQMGEFEIEESEQHLADITPEALGLQQGWNYLDEAQLESIVLLLDSQTALEIAFAQVEWGPVVYHCESSRAALLQHLS